MGAVRSFTGLTSWTFGAGNPWATVSLSFQFWGWSSVNVYANGGITLDTSSLDNILSAGPTQAGLYGPDWMSPPGDDVWMPLGVYPWVTPRLQWGVADPSAIMAAEWGEVTINGRKAFVVTWREVGRDDASGFNGTQRNTFQVVLYKGRTFELNYDSLEWSVAYYSTPVEDSSGAATYELVPAYGTYFDIRASARAGYRLIDYAAVPALDIQTDFANQSLYEFPGSTDSLTDYIAPGPNWTYIDRSELIDGAASALVSGSLNSPVPGRYVFFPTPNTLRQRQSPRRSPSRVGWY